MCHALKIKGKMIHKKIVMQREWGGGGVFPRGLHGVENAITFAYIYTSPLNLVPFSTLVPSTAHACVKLYI